MSTATAFGLIGLSAMILGGLYLWRWTTSKGSTVSVTTPSGLIGLGGLLDPLKFLIAWGFGFLILAVIGQLIPPLGGGLALMIIVTSVAGNLAGANKTVAAAIKEPTGGGNPALGGTSAGEAKTAVTQLVKGLHTTTVFSSAVKPFQTGF